MKPFIVVSGICTAVVFAAIAHCLFNLSSPDTPLILIAALFGGAQPVITFVLGVKWWCDGTLDDEEKQRTLLHAGKEEA